MANYYLNGDGTISQNKKQSTGKNYYLHSNGTISLNSEEDEEKKRREEQEKQERVAKQQAETEKLKKQETLPTATYGPNTNTILPTAKEEKEAKYQPKLDLSQNGEDIKKIQSGEIKTESALKHDIKQNAKKTAGTVADVGLNIVQGFVGVAENSAPFFAGLIAEAAEKAGNKEYADRVRRNIADPNLKIFNNTLQKGKDAIGNNSWANDTVDQMFQGIGQTAGYASLGALPGGAALNTGAMFTSAAGGELSNLYGSEDYKNGDLRNSKIWAKAIGSGAIEAAAERTFGYFGAEGGIDKQAANYLSGLASTSLGKMFARQGVNALAEGTEEVMSYAGNYLLDSVIDWVDQKTGGTGEALRQPWNWQELWQQAFTAAGSALIMGGFDTAITAKSVNGTSVSDTLNKTAQKMDLNAQLEKVQNQNEKLQKNLGKNISQQEVDNIFNQLQGNQQQISNIQSQLEVLPTAKNSNQNTQALQNNMDINVENAQQTPIDNNKVVNNESVGPLNDILNNKDLPMQNYIYEKSNNEKINNLREDASKYFNNSEKAHNYMKMLEKIIEDKNIDIRLDGNLKTPDGRIVNGSYSNGVITINPNSTRAGEFIAIHELTHAIGTDSMKNIVETYRKSNIEFNAAVEKLLQNYDSTEITEEALSDVSAQLFRKSRVY